MKLTGGLAIGFVAIVAATLYLIIENMSGTTDTALAPIEVKVVAHEWWWEFDYPKLGVKVANELRIPEKRTVRLELISADVLHSFWLPSTEKRVDVIPGKTSTLLITARSPGTLHGSCDASCGCNTVCMRFRVIVTNELEFGQWIDRRRGVSLAPRKNSAPSCVSGRMSQKVSSLTAVERLAAILSGKNGTQEALGFFSP
jgi:cytochrome c oxidase subunit 2